MGGGRDLRNPIIDPRLPYPLTLPPLPHLSLPCIRVLSLTPPVGLAPSRTRCTCSSSWPQRTQSPPPTPPPQSQRAQRRALRRRGTWIVLTQPPGGSWPPCATPSSPPRSRADAGLRGTTSATSPPNFVRASPSPDLPGALSPLSFRPRLVIALIVKLLAVQKSESANNWLGSEGGRGRGGAKEWAGGVDEFMSIIENRAWGLSA